MEMNDGYIYRGVVFVTDRVGLVCTSGTIITINKIRMVICIMKQILSCYFYCMLLG